VDNQGDMLVDPITGHIWVSEVDPNTAGAFRWADMGSLKGPAGTVQLGMLGVVEFALDNQDGLAPLPQQQMLSAGLLHSYATNSGSDVDAVIDMVIPRAPRWWAGAVSPTQAGFSLPAYTVAGGGTQQVEAQPWDLYLDFGSGNVFIYDPLAGMPRVGGGLAGLLTPLPAGIPNVVYRVNNPIPDAVAAAVAGVQVGDYIEFTATGWQVYVPPAALGSWRAQPIGNVRGPQGPPGPGLRYRGEWNPAGKAPNATTNGPPVTGLAVGAPPVVTDAFPNTPYTPGDIVTYKGITYMITQSSVLTNPDGT
jgi:hypothetical protein